MLELVAAQIEQAKQSYRISDISDRPDGSIQMVIANMSIPAQWNREKIDVLVVLPAGYPQTMPSGFSARFDGANWSGVCYRPNAWNPAKDNVWKWVKIIERYFQENRP